MSIVTSPSAAARVEAAARFVRDLPPATELLIVGATRGAADDFARAIAGGRAATFGLHRFSLTQLAARLAAPALALDRTAPTTVLGAQAVAARAAFDARQAGALAYFEPVVAMPGFPRALARTLEELTLAGVPATSLTAAGAAGRDLAGLLDRFEDEFRGASAVDRAAFLATATDALAGSALAGCPIVLLDVAIESVAEQRFVRALVARAAGAVITIPAGDRSALEAFAGAAIDTIPEDGVTGLSRLRAYLFADDVPIREERDQSVEWLSAPGEGREAIEIARRVLREARRGVKFDEMAVLLRSPQQYLGLIDAAFARAGVPAYFERGTRRPHPAGRAFLAILACASEGLSARRFAEYLSLAQVPRADAVHESWPAPSDEVFGALSDRVPPDAEPRDADLSDLPRADAPELVHAPWKWESLLVDSSVIGGAERWRRRLEGLRAEWHLRIAELRRTEPDSGRIAGLERRIGDLDSLMRFALPIVDRLATWPAAATWREWLEHFEALAPRVLQWPAQVLRLLADLRPMGAVGPVTLDEARLVLAERLTTIHEDPPARRYGCVFIGTPQHARGRRFEVVFLPGLAERMFPQKLREDPLLTDDRRQAVSDALVRQPARRDRERLQLHLAVGAAATRLYLSFPTLEMMEGRPRVPSLYALEAWRALTGRVPSPADLQRLAASTASATLAWPAPRDPDEAIDDLEHDLAILGRLFHGPREDARGRANYILQLNDHLQRAVRERYMRTRPAWTHWDGIVRVTDRTRGALERHRLNARPYSLSALQKYADCPYKFLLGAIYRLEPFDIPEPLQQMDPLTRGSLFHAIQASFYRTLKAEGRLPVSAGTRAAALETLDQVVEAEAAAERERLAPAIDRVWRDEIAAIRRDLRLWIDEVITEGGEWRPLWFEWSFGLPLDGRDPSSVRDPVLVGDRFTLHGSIDLVEEHRTTGELRVTDHKTGKCRALPTLVVGGGATLQPAIYPLAVEAATGRRVVEGRLFFATIAGRFARIPVPITDAARHRAVEVLEIIDRAVADGFLAPAPREKACAWCEFRPVCGPALQDRPKAHDRTADLDALRRMP